MNRETIGCGNEQCQCVVTAAIDPRAGVPADAYCSSYCSDASTGEEQDTCACGHPPCDEP